MTAEETLDEPPTEESTDETTDRDQSHLTDVEDGAGCTEIWEHLSDRRENDADEE
ncbi:hypothetical protein [Halorussus caseinilyticus]|uniref:Uncharacterized protein n=1 Tax=Halorussus caseinilyticus TaxID=3034025 RepID=A0ABD5WW05_9EURY|nr:hypothetical protein [Halorussus sp. DT72]